MTRRLMTPQRRKAQLRVLRKQASDARVFGMPRYQVAAIIRFMAFDLSVTRTEASQQIRLGWNRMRL